jgi:hypothetical protein
MHGIGRSVGHSRFFFGGGGGGGCPFVHWSRTSLRYAQKRVATNLKHKNPGGSNFLQR